MLKTNLVETSMASTGWVSERHKEYRIIHLNPRTNPQSGECDGKWQNGVDEHVLYTNTPSPGNCIWLFTQPLGEAVIEGLSCLNWSYNAAVSPPCYPTNTLAAIQCLLIQDRTSPICNTYTLTNHLYTRCSFADFTPLLQRFTRILWSQPAVLITA